MIEVGVRHDDNVDSWQLIDLQCRRGQTLRPNRKKKRHANSNSREEHWIGDNLHAEEIDQHSRVPEPCGGEI
jgi:Ni,Fe-hydrogenase III large subunit